ncbi:xanthine dehydrogenase family protein subunit M [Bacillus sp. B15-48]|uniref:FAD binding domain-containing protein n=1 Tax=Bacillus sp. B15-48 TaxID=1548601 RepID=UPI00193F4479|nr:xanthine dehydrogenase family protein subunit M [Bacillus sp. B15-48]MBM4763625.1 xanthine dehydrogenase [Bacillus sp. B15-48]
MISFDFEYYKPTSLTEATQLYQSLEEQGKQPMYFSGGTELITLGRRNQLFTDAAIDIKAIPECLVLKKDNNQVILGAAQTLTRIRDMQLFPFLNKVIVEIADHTARNKVTLGGNICANIIFRETVLPLLLTDSQVVIASQTGLKQLPIKDVFNQTLQLDKGEFLVQVITELSEMEWPSLSVKKRRQWDVGYPLITVAALKKNEQIKVAFSGLCSFPFRDMHMEDSLNNQQLSLEARVDKAIERIPAPILDDVNGSAEYRRFVLKNTLHDVLNELEGAANV